MHRLKELREARGWKMKDAAAEIGIPYTTYRGYENGDRGLDSELLIQFADFYDVSIDYLLCRDQKVVQFKPPLVQKYEQLDDTAKRVVDSVMEIESERAAEKPAAENAKIIPLFPAAAGKGEYLGDLEAQTIEVDKGSKATVAVRISGDSMEPYFSNGDVVLVEPKKPVDGDIAVVMVSGFLLVKQFVDTIEGQFCLLSLNRERSDMDYNYYPSSGDNVQFWGVVIGEKVPLVRP